MKILLISVKTNKSKGGIAAWTEHYLKECNVQNIEVHLVNTKVTGKRSENLSAKRRFIDELKRTRRIFSDLKAELEENKFDVAHLNTSIGVFGIIRDYYIAKRIAKKQIPIFLHFHCDISFWTTNSLIKYFLGKILKISAVNFVLCESSKKFLCSEFKVDSKKIPNFVDASIIGGNKKINNEVKNIFFVGRVSSLKGAREIFELAKRFSSVEFNLAGEICDEVSMWEKPKNINFLGPLPNDLVISKLDASDVFLFPTYTEGFSMALAECMARGVPAIATDVGANLDMLENKGGIVVDVSDVDAMEEALLSMKNPLVREKMSEWCIEKVKKEYLSHVVLKKLLEVYDEV